MANYVKIVMGLVGLLVALYLLQAVLPLLFAFSSNFSGSGTWGTFGAAILPTIFPLILAVAILVFIIRGATGALGGGKYKL